MKEYSDKFDKTGGTLNGDVFVKSSLPTIRVIGNLRQGGFQQDGYSTYLSNKSLDGTKYSAFVIDANGVLNDRFVCVVDGVNYRIFGEHNKPRGHYNGDGTLSKKNINTGGIGGFLKITSSNSDGIVGERGGIFWNNGNVVALPASEVQYSNGILTINSTSVHVNFNGDIYYYVNI